MFNMSANEVATMNVGRDEVLFQKWLTALRSGDYKQTIGQLRSVDPVAGAAASGFCCLGVLCDVYDSKGWGTGDHRGGLDMETYIHKDIDHAVLAPEDIAARVGISNTRMSELAVLNDNGYSFAVIADQIEHPAGV